MSLNHRTLSPTDANILISELPERGTQVFDLRLQSEGEREESVAQIKLAIKKLLKDHGLRQDFPLMFVGGSGKTEDPEVLAEAYEMGKTLQAVVTGGSQYSVMGEVANGAQVRVGITCEDVMGFETPDSRYDVLIVVNGKSEAGLENRLKLARELTKQDLLLHGGVGTLEELLGGIKARKKIAVLTPYWSPLIETLKTMYSSGYVSQKELDKVKPVNAEGTPIDDLSTGIAPRPDLAEYQANAERVVRSAKIILEQRRAGTAKILDGKDQLNGALTKNEFFVLPPANLQALQDAVLIMAYKRFGMQGSAHYQELIEKPLVILNIDGFYDGLMTKLHQMEKGGFLMENLSQLITEVKIDSHAAEPDIRSALATALPHAEPELRVKLPGQAGASEIRP